MATQVISGARVVLKFGQFVLGYCINVGVTSAINYQPINVLGTLAVVEHVPVAYTVEMNASVSRIAALSRLAATATELGGNAGDDKIQSSSPGTPDVANPQSPRIMPAYNADGQEILKSGELEATIVDVVSGDAIMKVFGVRCSNKSVEFAAGSAVAENLTFVAKVAQEKGVDLV